MAEITYHGVAERTPSGWEFWLIDFPRLVGVGSTSRQAYEGLVLGVRAHGSWPSPTDAVFAEALARAAEYGAGTFRLVIDPARTGGFKGVEPNAAEEAG
jgi:hypothetical protein